MSSYNESDHARDASGKYAPMTSGETDVAVLDAGDSVLSGDGYSYNELDREERIELMKSDLSKAVNSIVDSGQLGAYLDARAANRLGTWSMNNRMLAAIQLARREGIRDWEGVFNRMNSMDCGTYKQWEKRGRKVTSGPGSALYITAPCTRWITDQDPEDPSKERKRKIVTGFKPSSTFDISQTEGDPVPQHPSRAIGDDAQVMAGTHEGLQARIESVGYSYSEEEISGSNPAKLEGRLGYTNPRNKKVVVDSRLSPAMKVSITAHELGHIELGHLADMEEYNKHRGAMETETEAFTYMMMRHRGLSAEQSSSFSPGYIAGWSQGDHRKITKSIDAASKKFSEVTESLGW